jgi:hypothetical protein
VSLFHKHFPHLIQRHIHHQDMLNAIQKSITNEKGEKFELLVCEVVENNGTYYKQYKQRKAEVLYIKTEENGVTKMKLQQELEKLCCFGTLDSHKIASRLGMLQAGGKGISIIRSSHIKIVEEGGQDGCGYAPPGEFSGSVSSIHRILLKTHSTLTIDFFRDCKECPYKKADAMQVRIIGPRV